MAMFGPLGGMPNAMGGGKKPGGFDMGMDRKRSMMADALDRPDFGASPQAGGMPKVAPKPMMPTQQTLGGVLGGGGAAQPSPMDRNMAMTRLQERANAAMAPQPATGMPVKQKVRQQLVGSGVRGPSTPAGAVATAFGGLTGYK